MNLIGFVQKNLFKYKFNQLSILHAYIRFSECLLHILTRVNKKKNLYYFIK